MPNLRVFSIPATAPFLTTLIRALIAGELIPGFPASHDPLALAAATLYLPTRRACRRARDLFLNEVAGDAAILPRIVALGDIDEDEIIFAQAATGGLAAPALELQPALAPLERRLLLAQLVLKWAAGIAPEGSEEAALVPRTPLAALALADDLGRLIDDMITRGVAWERFDTLVPEDLDRYWQLTLNFLKIARVGWPAILEERGVIEPTARRDALLRAEAARLALGRAGPVIAAGSTGSMPATAELLATIAALPNGAVVLPGLDTHLEDEAWQLIGGSSLHCADASSPSCAYAAEGGLLPAVSHPQSAMQALLRRMGLARDEVKELGQRHAGRRDRAISEALRPAAASEQWRNLSRGEPFLQQAMQSISVIEAEHAEEEALAIAIVLREAVEEHKTAALVTPDRRLARRVLAALARWNIQAEDSGGEPLITAPAGSFACLAAEAVVRGLAPTTLLALLKHRLTRLLHSGLPRATSALEKAVLRGSRPRPGTAGLAHALAALRNELAKMRNGQLSDVHPSDPRARLTNTDLRAAAELIEVLGDAFSSMENLPAEPQSLVTLAARHQSLVTIISTDENGLAGAFSGPDGAQLGQIFEEVASVAADADLVIGPDDYPDFFKALISERIVRAPEQTHAPVHIYGPLEARLQSVERVVLGGLVEGVWPPEVRSDAWLSRPMRRSLGLDLPERRIALSAHDFAESLGAPEVVLAYASRVGGAPTVISRFVQRLAAVAGEERWNAARAQGEKYVRWARSLNRPNERERIERPMPKPPRAARPSSLSVTEIETWLRDPYSIYAKHILKLPVLEMVDLAPGASDRGMVVHSMVGDFTKQFPSDLPDNAADLLLEVAIRHFSALEDYPEARALWWPRFVRIARWFAAWDAGRRAGARNIAAELGGKINIALNEGVFTLRARADRIEQLADGSYAILDFKTGQVPTEKQVRIGISPQLSLEGAILRGGGFSNIPAGASISELVYVALKGGEPAGEERQIKVDEPDYDAHADAALAKLRMFASRFEDDQCPYVPLVMPMWKARYGPYDHLARVKEWSVSEEEEQAPE